MSISKSQDEQIVVQLATPGSEANAAAVASTMHAVVAIVEEAQRQLSSNESLLLKARPFNKGSFEIPLELIAVSSAIAFEQHPLIDSIIRILLEYIELRKRIQGVRWNIDSADSSIAILQNLEFRDSVVNILLNSRVNAAVDQAATDVAADSTIKEVRVFRRSEPTRVSTIGRDELEYFRQDSHLGPLEETSRDRIVLTTIVVHTPVLSGKGKWKFVFDGHTISARIADEEFMDRVRRGEESFTSGDRMDVELSIYEEFEPSLAAFRARDHVVTRVFRHRHRPPTESGALFE